MRTLSSNLLAAQKSSARLPYVKVEIVEKVGGITRLRWERLYSGSEPDSHHAATMPADGSLIRARTEGTHLYYQRVANPGPASDFTIWEDWASDIEDPPVALCSFEGRVALACVPETWPEGHRWIAFRESTDNGTTWGGWVALLETTEPIDYLTMDYKDSDVITLFYSIGGIVYAIKRSNGTWGSPQAWSNSVSSITGHACVYWGDWNLVVTGQDASGNYKVWTCVYGDGYSMAVGSWSSLAELTVANSGSGVEFHCPSLGFPDVFRTFFIEKYTGAEAYSRPCWSYSLATAEFISNLWREPVPFDLSTSHGLALAYGGSHVWLSMPSGVWRAALSPSPLDVSADVVGLVARTEPTSGKLRIELRNDDGRYQEIGSGGYAAITEGSEVLVSPGYRTSSGEEVSPGLAYWIEGWEYLSEGGRANFVIYASDGWGLLNHWKARRQFSWVAGSKNIFQLLAFIFARVGLEFSVFSNSSALVNQYPAFTIHPGESGATAVRRLLDMVPDVLFFRGHYAYIKNPQASDQSVYSYGTDHPLWEGRYASDSPGYNRVQVYGAEVLSESFSWLHVSKVYDRLHQVHDLNLNTVEKAQGRAEAELREALTSAISGEIRVPVNCGQELYDVIDITDERAGLVAAKRRILGLVLLYSTGRDAHYDQRLLLGEV